jgi:hypothetical protein
MSWIIVFVALLLVSTGHVECNRAVLTVGDGNFGFSVALCTRLAGLGEFRIVATSFDSHAQVLSKYPESKALLSRLESNKAVKVIHGVDACDLGGPSPTSRQVQELGPYDLVLFNFPHTGTEDFRRHQALLAHFFDSSKSILSPHGQVQVTLSNDQPSRWAVIKMAALARLKLLEARPFYPECEFPGYVMRRHSNGKSFKPHINHRFTFACPAPGTEGENLRDSAHPKSRTNEMPIWLPADPSQQHLAQREVGKQPGTDGQHTGPGVQSPETCVECERTFGDSVALMQHRKAKHGRHPDIKPDWFTDAAAGAPQGFQIVEGKGPDPCQSATPWWCRVCRIGFDSEAALSSHRRSLQPASRAEHACDGCARKFAERRALLQHVNFCAGLAPP